MKTESTFFPIGIFCFSQRKSLSCPDNKSTSSIVRQPLCIHMGPACNTHTHTPNNCSGGRLESQ